MHAIDLPNPMMARHAPPLPPSIGADCAFFLDIDGTLIEIAETPDAVSLDARLLGLVECLYRASDGALALISGRSIADIDRLLGRPDIPLAGQHGLEQRCADGITLRPAEPSASLDPLRAMLKALVASHPTLLVEDKGQSIAVHYRRAPTLAGFLHRHLRQAIADHPGLALQRGKCVLEVKPAGIDKGAAIAAFLTKPPFRDRKPVFIGDDVTDEAGFVVVNAFHGISIKVGTGPSQAQYRLPNVTEVRSWLSRVALEICA